MTFPIQPGIDSDNEGFWRATAGGALELCWCPACQLYRHPPVDVCPKCWGPNNFRAVSGRGTLFSFIVVHRAISPGYPVPHLIGLVELAEQPGLRLPAQLTDIDHPTVGLPVQAVIEPLPGGDQHIPVWHPAFDSADDADPSREQETK